MTWEPAVIEELNELIRRLLAGEDPDQVLADLRRRDEARCQKLAEAIARAQAESDRCSAVLARYEGRLH